jgi:hypothetical protein
VQERPVEGFEDAFADLLQNVVIPEEVHQECLEVVEEDSEDVFWEAFEYPTEDNYGL